MAPQRGAILRSWGARIAVSLTQRCSTRAGLTRTAPPIRKPGSSPPATFNPIGVNRGYVGLASDPALLAAVDRALADLQTSGKIADLAQAAGVTYLPPREPAILGDAMMKVLQKQVPVTGPAATFVSTDVEGSFAKTHVRHCEERSDEAIQSFCFAAGLLRFARNDVAVISAGTPTFVIPGCAPWRRPGIHTPCGGYGFRARARARPRNDGCRLMVATI